MSFFTLLRHRWLQTVRSVSLTRNVLRSMLAAFMGLYLALVFVGMGWAFPLIVRELGGGASPLAVLNRYLLSGFAVLTAVRFFLQGAPGGALAPYLHLPVSRSRLVRYEMVASLGSWFNAVPLCFLAPIVLKVNWAGGALGALCWSIRALGALAITHYAALGLRAMLGRSVSHFVLVVGALVVLLGVDIGFGWGLTTEASAALFGGLEAGSLGGLAVVGTALGSAFVLTARAVRRSLWADGSGSPAAPRFAGRRLSIGDSLTARLVELDLRLILRNRRPRQMMGSQVVLLVVLGVMIVTLPSDELQAAHIMLGLFASSLLAVGFGQFLHAWDSAHFDGLLARIAPPDKLLQARLFTLYGLGAVSYLLVLPLLVWSNIQVLWISAAGLLYNMGVTFALTLGASLWNRKSIDLDEQAFFNYEGFSGSQFALTFLVILPPLVVFLVLPFGWALGLVSAVGALGVALTPWWTRALTAGFVRRRHLLAAGYRSE